jgi:hypothetical protein
MAGFLKCLQYFALVVNRLEALYLEHLRRQFSDKSPILELFEASFKPSKAAIYGRSHQIFSPRA